MLREDLNTQYSNGQCHLGPFRVDITSVLLNFMRRKCLALTPFSFNRRLNKRLLLEMFTISLNTCEHNSIRF